MPIYTVQSITSVVSVSADCVPRAKVSSPNRRPVGTSRRWALAGRPDPPASSNERRAAMSDASRDDLRVLARVY